MSIAKKIQSELGTTGEPSPNIELVDKVGNLLNEFDHTHDTITDKDCFVFISSVSIGTKYKEKELRTARNSASSGCYRDLKNLFLNYLIDNPDLIPVIGDAVVEAIDYLNDQK